MRKTNNLSSMDIQPCPTTVPSGMGELHGGQVVHDSDVDEAVGVVHDAEDGLEVLSPASCTEGWRGTLTE